MQNRQRTRKALRLVAPLLSIGFLFVSAGWSPPSDDPSFWTTDQWVAWRDAQIKRILTPTWDAGDKKVLDRAEVILRCVDAYKTIAPLLNDPNFMPIGSDRATRLGNFVQFVTAEATMAIYDGTHRYTHALGFPFTDKEYWEKSSGEVQFPGLLRDQRFLDAMASPAGYPKAEQMIRENNESLPENRKWIVLSYRSQFLKSADGATYGRMLVLVPNEPDAFGGTQDQWFQFATDCPNELSKKLPSSVSEVAVHRSKSGQGPAAAFLVDFLRQTDPATGRTDIVPTMLVEKNPSKQCYDCHKTPVLPIYPKAVYGPGSSLVGSVNERIEGYGKCSISFAESAAFGPTIGQAQYKPSLDSLKADAEAIGLGPESAQKIRDAMRCGECHFDAKKINYPAAVDSNIGYQIFEEKKGLAQTYVENGWMPPGNTLSTTERGLLWKSLAKQYFDPADSSGAFIDWLRGRDNPNTKG